MEKVEKDSSISKDSALFYEYQIRYYLYLYHYYSFIGNKIECKRAKKAYELSLKKIHKFNLLYPQFKKALPNTTLEDFSKNPDNYPFHITMELVNQNIFKPFSIKLHVRALQKRDAEN